MPEPLDDPASDPGPARRRDWPLIIALAAVGVIAGPLVVALVLEVTGAIIGDPPLRPEVLCSVSVQKAKPGATLDVVFFNRASYSRSAPDADSFAAEIALWEWTPLVLKVVGGVLVGAWLGRFIGRRL